MVYVLCLRPGHDGARHYVGRTNQPLELRLAQHIAGAGARWTTAAVRSGCVVNLVAVFPDGDERLEERLKREGTDSLCPCCHRERNPAALHSPPPKGLRRAA